MNNFTDAKSDPNTFKNFFFLLINNAANVEIWGLAT